MSILLHIYWRLTSFFSYFLYRFIFKIKIGHSFKAYGIPLVFSSSVNSIVIGEGVKLSSSLFANPLLNMQPVFLRTLLNGRIHIGDRSSISSSSIVATESIHIGNDCLIGPSCLFIDSNHHPISPSLRLIRFDQAILSSPIVIEDNVFIGTRCVVLKGVHIGQ